MSVRGLLPLLAGLIAATPAVASTSDDIDDIGLMVDRIALSATQISNNVGIAGRGMMTPEAAREKYEEYVYMRLLGRNKEAAEGLFGLVQAGSLGSPQLAREAEWHLAEALVGMGNTEAAKTRFERVAGDPGHGFRGYAVQRLLILHAESGEREAFKTLYDTEVASGKVRATPELLYVSGKAFYRDGQFDRAGTEFAKVAATSSYHPRAQYFLGVLDLLDKDFDAARLHFQAASVPMGETITATSDDQRVRDLAVLAQARLDYEAGDFASAAERYSEIGIDSDYLAEVQYEQAWSYIKQDRYDEAMQSVGIFLLAFPEHRYAGELRVIEGHLYMGCAQDPGKCPDPGLAPTTGNAYDQALASYEGIVADYSPIRDYFGSLAADRERARVFFEDVLAMRGAADRDVPRFAMAMLREDPKLETALELQQSLTEQRADLEACDEMIAQISTVLDRTTGGGFETARLEAIANQGFASKAQLQLFEVQRAWLEENRASGLSQVDDRIASFSRLVDKAMVRANEATDLQEAHSREVNAERRRIEAKAATADELRAEKETFEAGLDTQASRARRESEKRIAELSTELTALETELDEERVGLSRMQLPGQTLRDPAAGEALRSAARDVVDAMGRARPKTDDDGLADRFALQASRLDRLQVRFGKLLDRMSTLAEHDLNEMRDRFEREVANVAAERTDLIRTADGSEQMFAAMSEDGLERLEAFFADSVMRADTGIIDVYWARKLELANEREALQERRNTLVTELERRFDLIRQKMEQ